MSFLFGSGVNASPNPENDHVDLFLQPCPSVRIKVKYTSLKIDIALEQLDETELSLRMNP